MIQPIKVILEEDGRLRPLVAIDPPGDGSRELAIIVLPWFPFDDLSSDKSRPALVLSTVSRNRYLVAYVTSQEKQRARGA